MKSLIDYVPSSSNDWSYLDRFFAILAEENLTVVRSSRARTASIDLARRVLTIPAFGCDNKDVLLLMGSHEVSHALHTPKDWYLDHNSKTHKSLMRDCLNIVEDIRIEKLIRKKFPGFVDVYIRGYQALLGRGFFSVDKWDRFKIHDRVNAYAKVGKNLPAEMTDFDLGVYRYVSGCATFDDVRKRAAVLARLVNAETESNRALTLDDLFKIVSPKTDSADGDFCDAEDGIQDEQDDGASHQESVDDSSAEEIHGEQDVGTTHQEYADSEDDSEEGGNSTAVDDVANTLAKNQDQLSNSVVDNGTKSETEAAIDRAKGEHISSNIHEFHMSKSKVLKPKSLRVWDSPNTTSDENSLTKYI